jgi:hypothetical protein
MIRSAWALLATIAFLSGSIVPAGAAQYEVRLVQEADRYPFSAPLGMNESGVIVGYAGPEAFSPFSVPIRVEPSGELTVVSLEEPNFGFARGIDESGAAIAGEYGWRPHLWADGVRTLLPVPEGYFSGVARDVSEGGIIVGSFADYDDPLPPNPVGPRPCLWPSADGPAMPLRRSEELRSPEPARVVQRRGKRRNRTRSRIVSPMHSPCSIPTSIAAR